MPSNDHHIIVVFSSLTQNAHFSADPPQPFLWVLYEGSYQATFLMTYTYVYVCMFPPAYELTRMCLKLMAEQTEHKYES